ETESPKPTHSVSAFFRMARSTNRGSASAIAISAKLSLTWSVVCQLIATDEAKSSVTFRMIRRGAKSVTSWPAVCEKLQITAEKRQLITAKQYVHSFFPLNKWTYPSLSRSFDMEITIELIIDPFKGIPLNHPASVP